MVFLGAVFDAPLHVTPHALALFLDADSNVFSSRFAALYIAILFALLAAVTCDWTAHACHIALRGYRQEQVKSAL